MVCIVPLHLLSFSSGGIDTASPSAATVKRPDINSISTSGPNNIFGGCRRGTSLRTRWKTRRFPVLAVQYAQMAAKKAAGSSYARRARRDFLVDITEPEGRRAAQGTLPAAGHRRRKCAAAPCARME